MKSLYIVGAGGAAKEIYLLIKEINRVNIIYDFKGFIDLTDKTHLKIGNENFDIINEVNFLNEVNEETAIVFAIADTQRINTIISKYKQKNMFEFPTLIHPSVILDDSISIGAGNVISVHSVFTVDISIGEFNYFNRAVQIGHDCVIGSFNVINPCAVVSGGVSINNENLIGTNATILQYLNIGSKNIIGAGAVVVKDVNNNSCMIGVPAKNKNNE